MNTQEPLTIKKRIMRALVGLVGVPVILFLANVSLLQKEVARFSTAKTWYEMTWLSWEHYVLGAVVGACLGFFIPNGVLKKILK